MGKACVGGAGWCGCQTTRDRRSPTPRILRTGRSPSIAHWFPLGFDMARPILPRTKGEGGAGIECVESSVLGCENSNSWRCPGVVTESGARLDLWPMMVGCVRPATSRRSSPVVRRVVTQRPSSWLKERKSGGRNWQRGVVMKVLGRRRVRRPEVASAFIGDRMQIAQLVDHRTTGPSGS